MTAVYNEIDPFAAQWLRELIKANMIAPGEVWENDIRDIRPRDLRGVVQFHAFAGIGVWSYAARRAGWPDDRPIWSASCPCQPFSAAGAGAGFADERHLWPHFYHLAGECRPAVIVGEQVASKDADAWIDLVQADMEALGYAFGAVAFPSASVGAPHIRDRTYWMAYAGGVQPEQPARQRSRSIEAERGWSSSEFAGCGHLSRLDHHHHEGLEGQRRGHQAESGWIGEVRSATPTGEFGGLAHDDRARPQPRQRHDPRSRYGDTIAATSGDDRHGSPGPTNGHWRDADWLFCRDGKWRPVEPGTFPLAHGAAARVGRLRGYGNAINAVQAQVFIEEVQDILHPAVDV